MPGEGSTYGINGTNNKNVNFPTQFCLGSISNCFSATESREVSLKGNVYGKCLWEMSVDYNAIVKYDILTFASI